MRQVQFEAPIDSQRLLDALGCPADVVGTIVEERLLPEGLASRLDTLYPEYSKLRSTSVPWFTGRENYSGLTGFRDVCSVLEANGVDIGFRDERELFIDVYRFLATRHTLNSIDWGNFANDSMFHLVFPQPGMIRKEVVEAYGRAETRDERRRIAAEYMHETNPHDGKQLLNKPWFTNSAGRVELLHGSQHKYPQCQLIFDKSTQHCFSFCTYCFRHAQVRGDEDMFVQEDIPAVHEYLRAHSEVNDMLITGGDAGFITADRFAQYTEPLIDDPGLIHVKTVRLGSRALTYHPELVLRPDYDPMLALFDRLYDNGIQVAWMSHFSTPGEVLNPLTVAAIRRLQAHQVVLRSQSPIMKHISLFPDESGAIDIDASAKNWIDLANIFGMLSIGFHSVYCARPTGEQHYFTAPLADLHKVFDKVYRSLPSINRPSRHLSMTTSAGKISILGTAEVQGETVFALKFTEGRDMHWLDRVFLARYDRETNNVAMLEPYDTDEFFFEEGLRRIEAELSAKLAELAPAVPGNLMIDKTVGSVVEAVSPIGDGTVVMIGGFGEAGSPIELIHALIDQGARNLTAVNNNTGNGEVGLAALIANGQVSRMICSYPRSSHSKVFPQLYRAGRVELELVPQGTLAERIRAGGAGIPAFYTPSAVGTPLAEGKEVRELEGRSYLLEHWLKADFALIRCEVADRMGNLTYNKTARNFGPLMCMAAETTIVQARKVVEAGEIDPEHVVTPGIFVDRVVEVAEPLHESELIAKGAIYP